MKEFGQAQIFLAGRLCYQIKISNDKSGIKDLGTETIAGKDCKKFSAEFGGSPIVSWTWNNILIKSVTKMGGADFVIEATKIQDGSVDSKIFELPAGVTFKEM